MIVQQHKAFRPSGLAQLGELPNDWTISRLGYEAWVRARLGWKGLKAEEYVDDGFVFLATPNIKGRHIDFDNVNYINKQRYEESPEIKLSEGDVLLAKDGSTLGTVNLVRELPRPATVNSSIAVITPGEMLVGLYLYYLFQSSYVTDLIQSIKGGMGVPHLFQEDLNKFRIPIPSISEQAAIAAFLDRETGKIDALVEEQRRLIELLKEKRQAVISHAVTKGLDPNARMKPSGVEWLGEVPAHWEVRSISSVSTKITNGYVGPTRDILVNEGVRYLQSLHIKGNRIVFDQPYYVTEAWSRAHAKSILEAGDVLVVQTGDIGQVAVVPDEFAGCNCHALIVIATVRAEIEGEWLSWVLNSDYGSQSLFAIQTGALHPHLNCGNVKGVLIPVPPIEEQNHIVAVLTKDLFRIDALAEHAERAIPLLQERRIALISAAVTGKIDVRKLGATGSEAA